MVDRNCPNCGELVLSSSIICPKCFRKIPVEPELDRKERVRKRGGQDVGRKYNSKIALILSIVPALVGLLGLGLIYRNPHQKRGYIAFVIGILFFVAAICFTMFLVTIFLIVPCWIIYVLIFLGCLAMVSTDNLFVRVV